MNFKGWIGTISLTGGIIIALHLTIKAKIFEPIIAIIVGIMIAIGIALLMRSETY